MQLPTWSPRAVGGTVAGVVSVAVVAAVLVGTWDQPDAGSPWEPLPGVASAQQDRSDLPSQDSASPSEQPSGATPTATPTPEPTPEPSAEPSPEPSPEPSAEPSPEPSPEPSAEPSPEPSAEPSPEPSPAPTRDVDALPEGPDTSLAPDEATVHVPGIGVVTTARPVGLQADGAMEVPDFGDSGWYGEGPMPGAPGPAVVVAHVSGPDGPDVFARLGELQAGDEVVVVTDSVTQQYRVTRTEVHPKDQLPNEEIWGATDQRELRLITCGGSWNASRRSYRDNIVVWAQPIGDA